MACSAVCAVSYTVGRKAVYRNRETSGTEGGKCLIEQKQTRCGGFRLLEPPDVVAGSVLQWLALGVIDMQPDVNGYQASHVLAGVTWTISYEWAFYA